MDFCRIAVIKFTLHKSCVEVIVNIIKFMMSKEFSNKILLFHFKTISILLLWQFHIIHLNSTHFPVPRHPLLTLVHHTLEPSFSGEGWSQLFYTHTFRANSATPVVRGEAISPCLSVGEVNSPMRVDCVQQVAEPAFPEPAKVEGGSTWPSYFITNGSYDPRW